MNYANDKKILRNSYEPTRAKFYKKHGKGDLDTRFQRADYDKSISNSDEYFEKVTITNFDLIHQQCIGDKPLHGRKYYETSFKKKVEHELNNRLHRDVFLSSALRCERKDVYFEKAYKKTILTNLSLKKN